MSLQAEESDGSGVWRLIQKCTYALFFFFLKKAIPIPDNTQMCVETYDEFQCQLRYKYCSKQKTFENHREGHASSEPTEKRSVFWIFNVDQSTLIYIPLQQRLYDSGEKKKNNKSVFLPISEMHIHILQGWCKA